MTYMTYTEDRSDPLRVAAQDIMDQAYQILGNSVPEFPFEVRISLTTFGREVMLVRQVNWPARERTSGEGKEG